MMQIRTSVGYRRSIVVADGDVGATPLVSGTMTYFPGFVPGTGIRVVLDSPIPEGEYHIAVDTAHPTWRVGLRPTSDGLQNEMLVVDSTPPDWLPGAFGVALSEPEPASRDDSGASSR